MSKKQVTSGTKAKKTIVNIIIHIFLAILSFICRPGKNPGRDPGEEADRSSCLLLLTAYA